MLTTFTKMSECTVPSYPFGTGYSGKQRYLSDNLESYLFEMHKEITRIVKMTTMKVEKFMIDLAVPSSSFTTDGRESSV